MLALKRTAFCFIFTVLVTLSRGQSDTSQKHENWLERDSIEEITWIKTRDSLRKEFYSQPKYLKMTFERNGKKQDLKSGHFFIILDGQEKELKSYCLEKYLPQENINTGQRVTLEFIDNKTRIKQELNNLTEIENGAVVVFGIVTNIYKKRSQQMRTSKTEHEYSSDTEKLYNRILSNENIKGLIEQKKIKNIQYVQVTPRVYGCGTSTIYYSY